MIEQARRGRRRHTILTRRIVKVMNAGFVIAVTLILAGIVIGLATGDHLPTETDKLRDILPGALRLDAQNVAELGIIVLLLTPAAYVVAALVTFLRDRDWMFVWLCLALLGILSLSVGLASR